jgi:heme-degrading monooxygenase HmoA
MMINVTCRRQSGLQEEPSQDKENVPPFCGHESTRKQRKVNRCNPLITISKWTNEALEEDAIENGTTSLRKANKHLEHTSYLIV